MKYFSIRISGFAFIEVVLAATVIAGSLGTVFSLQTTLFTSTAYQAEKIERLIALKNVFVQEAFKNFEAETVHSEETGARLSGEIRAVKEIPTLVTVHLQADWEGVRGKKKMQFWWYAVQQESQKEEPHEKT